MNVLTKFAIYEIFFTGPKKHFGYVANIGVVWICKVLGHESSDMS